jgi:hypothetical protein
MLALQRFAAAALRFTAAARSGTTKKHCASALRRIQKTQRFSAALQRVAISV